jgi:hypothetical protein
MSKRSSSSKKRKSQPKIQSLPLVESESEPDPALQNFEFTNKEVSVHLLCP